MCNTQTTKYRIYKEVNYVDDEGREITVSFTVSPYHIIHALYVDKKHRHTDRISIDQAVAIQAELQRDIPSADFMFINIIYKINGKYT